jgi:hypothetical protein
MSYEQKHPICVMVDTFEETSGYIPHTTFFPLPFLYLTYALPAKKSSSLGMGMTFRPPSATAFSNSSIRSKPMEISLPLTSHPTQDRQEKRPGSHQSFLKLSYEPKGKEGINQFPDLLLFPFCDQIKVLQLSRGVLHATRGPQPLPLNVGA